MSLEKHSKQQNRKRLLLILPSHTFIGKPPNRETYIAEEQSRDVSADVPEVALRVHVEISGGGEPAVALAAAEPVLEDEACDGAAFAPTGCGGGREGGREGGLVDMARDGESQVLLARNGGSSNR